MDFPPELHKIPDNSSDPNYDDFFLSYDTTKTVGIIASAGFGVVFFVLFIPLLVATIRFYARFLPVFTRGESMLGAVAGSGVATDSLCTTYYQPLRLSTIFLSAFFCAGFACFAVYGQRQMENENLYTHSGRGYVETITTEIVQPGDNVFVFLDMSWDFCPNNNKGGFCRSRREISSCAITRPCTKFKTDAPRPCDESELERRVGTVRGCVGNLLNIEDPDYSIFGDANTNENYFAENANETYKMLVQCPCNENYEGISNGTEDDLDSYLQANVFTIEDPYEQPIQSFKHFGYFCLAIGGGWVVLWSLCCGVFFGRPPWSWSG